MKTRNNLVRGIILIGAMAFMLAGCGGSDKESTKDSQTDATTEISIMEEDEYYDDTYDEEATEKEGEADSYDKGLLIASWERGGWNGSYSTFTVNLDIIDPDTGDVKHFRTFSTEDTQSCSEAQFSFGGSTTEALMSFSNDFSKMAAKNTMADGAQHVGWINQDGSFTDASEMVSMQTEFSAITNHSFPRFFDNYLYYTDDSNNDLEGKRVPIDNLSPEAVETMIEDATYPASISHPLPDGSVTDSQRADYEYYDSKLRYVANSNFFTDWISEKECIGDDDKMIYKYILNDDQSDSYHWYTKKIPLIPDVKGRVNWCGVVSPDCKNVAFLSRLTTETDGSAKLFLVSIDGGDPVEINTDYWFPSDFSSAGIAAYQFGIIDWR